MTELPRCTECRARILPGNNVVFRVDGRVQHVDCPPVMCAQCGQKIAPHTPIRRDGDQLLHTNCWLRWRDAGQDTRRSGRLVTRMPPASL